MENSQGSDGTSLGLDYWMQPHVFLSSLVFILPSATAVRLLRKRRKPPPNSGDLWSTCWRNLHPRWLLFYRVFAFAAMVVFLYQTVAAFGFFVFFFYTQWTFALVTVYFALAAVVSIRGCGTHSVNPARNGERETIINLEKEDFQGISNRNKAEQREGFIKLQVHPKPPSDEPLVGFLGNLLLIVYQTCAGAVMLTDIVFWGLLLPFMAGENFQLTPVIFYMHSVNAIFLLIESALHRMEFSWFGFIYFVLWSTAYIVFQWVLHACCITWWPYPFLDLANTSAPLWYLALALVHIPCYGLYVLIVRAKDATFSKMFPQSFVRVSTDKKQD